MAKKTKTNEQVYWLDYLKFRRAVLRDAHMFQVRTSDTSAGYLVPDAYALLYGNIYE